MNNPIFNPMNNQPNQQVNSNGMFSKDMLNLMNSVRNSPNPNAAAQQLLNNDPSFQGIAQYINQNGGSAQAAFYNMAAQKGQNPDFIINALKQFFGV